MAFYRRHGLSRVGSEKTTPIRWPISGLLQESLVKGGRELENPRLGGCAGSPQRTALRWLNSLITGKIQGISPKLGPARMLSSLKTNRFATKYPNRQNREFFLRNREPYSAKEGRSSRKGWQEGASLLPTLSRASPLTVVARRVGRRMLRAMAVRGRLRIDVARTTGCSGVLVASGIVGHCRGNCGGSKC